MGGPAAWVWSETDLLRTVYQVDADITLGPDGLPRIAVPLHDHPTPPAVTAQTRTSTRTIARPGPPAS
ncbi:hypothetical protein [Actinomadura sp. 3N508]|uniref:hypothetical protein n=1 Tax=Actinomadura sp. 3N508 TaxID=3375153 RepID=UPI0037A530C0